ncbi:MAG: flagellar motor switch protein FliM, partial [Planctomycetes bacterium]|nr:flagellar motor switch protein FliM [Planctomycetota bacterium]
MSERRERDPADEQPTGTAPTRDSLQSIERDELLGADDILDADALLDADAALEGAEAATDRGESIDTDAREIGRARPEREAHLDGAALPEREARLDGGALLDTDEGGDDPASAREPGWIPYDFRRKAAHLTERELDRLAERQRRAAAAAAEKLSRLLRTRVRIDPASLGVREYSEFTQSLPQPGNVHLVQSRAIPSTFLLSLTPRLVLAMLERLLGAPETTEPPPERALTPLEESMSQAVVRRVLEALDEGWRAGAPLGLEVLETESHPLLLQVKEPDAPVLLISFRVALKGASGDVQIAVPQGALLAFLSGSTRSCCRAPSAEADSGADDPGAEILERIDSVEVDLTAEITTRPLPLRALLGLQPGDLIDTGIPLDAAVSLRVG